MFLMIYAQLRLLYFCLGTILQEDSGGGGGVNPGAPPCWCSDSELQTLTNELCETTAIDIYLISPHPATVSTVKASHHPLSLFFLFPSLAMADASPHPSLTSPRGPLIGAPGQRRERERVKGRWRGEKVRLKASGAAKKHTLLCVFSCLLDELSYALHSWGKKGTCFYTTFWGVRDMNISHKASLCGSANFFCWNEGIATACLR